MATATKELERELKKARRTRPDMARFVEISYESEIEAGVRSEVAASKWFDKLMGRE